MYIEHKITDVASKHTVGSRGGILISRPTHWKTHSTVASTTFSNRIASSRARKRHTGAVIALLRILGERLGFGGHHYHGQISHTATE